MNEINKIFEYLWNYEIKQKHKTLGHLLVTFPKKFNMSLYDDDDLPQISSTSAAPGWSQGEFIFLLSTFKSYEGYGKKDI